MKGITDKDFELLNALSDGELSCLEKEKLLSRIQSDEALKLAYGEIKQVKEKISVIHASLLANNPAQTNKPKFNKTRYSAIAASIALVIALSALVLPFGQPSNTALAWHKSFSENRYVVKKEQSPLFISIQEQADIPIPDLSPSSLFLVEYQMLNDTDNNPNAAMHYRGLNGCRVTLWIGAKSDSQGSIDDAYLQQRWVVKNLEYQIIATGMDKRRFETVVDYIQSITIPEQKDEDEKQLLMASAYAEAKPCA